MNFVGRRTLVEDEDSQNFFLLETIFAEKLTLLTWHKDKLHSKTNFAGRLTSLEDELCWKTNFDEEPTSLEDKLCWKRKFTGRQS